MATPSRPERRGVVPRRRRGDADGMATVAVMPIDAATLARLRARADPESPGVCVYCGGAPMLPDGGTSAAGYARWRCPRCDRVYVTPGGDADLLALLTAYEALVRGEG